MNNATNAFRIRTRPRLLLGARLVDAVDANPVLALALVVAGIAGTLALVVLA